MKNRHRKCGGSFMLGSHSFQCENLDILAEADEKAASSIYEFRKIVFFSFCHGGDFAEND